MKRAELHQPRRTCGAGTQLPSVAEEYSLTKCPHLPKRKTEITRWVVDYDLIFIFFKGKGYAFICLEKNLQGYKQNVDLSFLGASQTGCGK